MVKNFKLFIIALLSLSYVQGQDSAKTAMVAPAVADTAKPAPNPSTTFSGSLDLYYRYNFANAPSFKNNYTSFTNSQNSFELGMATVRADHSWAKAGVTVELGFGRRAQDFSYNESANLSLFSLANVVQAYVYYNLTDKIKLTAGKWGTHIGYEVVDAALNRNYSMSYMFTYGPFYNMGLKADVSLGGKSAFMVGISNPTDNTTTASPYKSFIAQFSTATPDSKWKFYLNYQGGKYALGATLNQIDLVVTGVITDKFSIGMNGTDQIRKSESTPSMSWYGAALYLNYDPSPLFGLTLRSEYFSDKDHLLAITTDGGKFSEFTLSGNIRLGKLTVIPELRYDAYSTDQAFLKHDDTPAKSTFSGILAAVYVF